MLTNARLAVAHGSLNGGGPLLRLATSGGVIYLRRQNSRRRFSDDVIRF
jgi:hypothetical protein